jgi:hypothetical protein
MNTFKLGRLPRIYDPRVPKMDKLTRGLAQPAPPPTRDWSTGMPGNLGAMLNDQLGDCTAAAVGHARQVWTFNANPPIRTIPDALIEKLYEETTGYVPGDPSTDQGGVEQTVLTYWLKHGAPTLAGPDKLAAFVEVNPKYQRSCQRAINDCGVLYIGLEVPNYIMNRPIGPPTTWDIDPSGDQTIAGGHAVAVIGYNAAGFKFCSWGGWYWMTWAFWQAQVDEAYAIVNIDWIEKSGQSPSWFNLPALEVAMNALRS